MLLMVFLLILQSHENLEDMSVTQLRRICKEKGLTGTSWDRNKLLKLIAGAIVKSAQIQFTITRVFNMTSF